MFTGFSYICCVSTQSLSIESTNSMMTLYSSANVVITHCRLSRSRGHDCGLEKLSNYSSNIPYIPMWEGSSMGVA